MDMTFLTEVPNPSPVKWLKAKARFLGAENYVLREEPIEATLDHCKGGFKVRTKHHFAMPAEAMMGSRIREVHVHDVELVFTDLTLSLRHLLPKSMPRVYKEGDVVRLSG